MLRTIVAASILALLSVGAAVAEEAKLPEARNGLMPANQGQPTSASVEPKLDLSRSVTLTGSELDAIIRAQVLAARAKDAQEAVAPLMDRLRRDMTVQNDKTRTQSNAVPNQ